MMKIKVFSMVLCIMVMYAHAALTVQEKDGIFSILRDGKPWIESLELSLRDTNMREPQKSEVTLIDGSKVWNIWSENIQTNVRMEIAQRKDGAIEISMLSNILPMSESKSRMIYIKFAPGALDGKKYQTLEGNARAWHPQEGIFDKSFKSMVSHWMTADGILYDFNPMGASCYCNQYRMGAVRGVWTVSREKDGMHISGGSIANLAGGFTGCKMVIQEGISFEQYDKLHLMRTYHYNQHLIPKYLLSFGAPAVGKNYSNGNISIGQGAFGWKSEMPKAVVGYNEGALYSCVTGKSGVYQIKGLPDGFYVCTVTAGNYAGVPNKFSLRFANDVIRKDVTVPPRKLWIASKTVHVKGGILDIALEGQYIVSTIGVQPLMSDAEDYSMQRCFWVTEGYEPALVYRNADFPRNYNLPISEEWLDMPVPGTEMSAPYHKPPRPTLLPSNEMPSLSWLNDMKMGSLGAGMNLAHESCPQDLRTTFIDSNVNGKGYNCVMSGFMHSRHTFPERFEDGIEYNRTLAQEAHKRNLKFIDHHDVTILWNQQSGLRTLAERLPELCRGLDDHLPSFQLCPLNPAFKKAYFDYWRKNVEAGVDGFQLDEVQFWNHSCSCQYCRAAFTRDTGWIYPLNELNRDLNNTGSIFYRKWHDWKMAVITNWFIDLRKYVEDIKPDLVLSMYTTHWGFTRSFPNNKAGYDILDLARTFNMFGTEVMTRNVIKSSRSLLPLRKMKNIITKEYGTRIWGIYYTSDWQSTYFAWAVANMCGQSSLIAFDMPPEAPDFRTFAMTPGNMKVTGAENIAEIGLLFSAPSRDWNRSLGFESGLFGLAQELEAMHIPYEMIGNMSLRPELLKKYKILSIGSSACLSDAELAAIMKFAEEGGTVMMTTVAGLCDESGIERKEWPFAKLFGFKPWYYTKWKVNEIDGMHSDIAVRTFIDPQRYNILNEERAYGKGRLIYRGLDWENLFCTSEKSHNEKWIFTEKPELEAQFKAYLGRQLKDVSYWKVDAPSQVYTSIWRESDGTRAIHFLNATGAKMKVGEVLGNFAPNPAFPPLAKDITFQLKGKVSSITAASPSFKNTQPLKFTANADGTVTAVLPADLAQQYVILKVK